MPFPILIGVIFFCGMFGVVTIYLNLEDRRWRGDNIVGWGITLGLFLLCFSCITWLSISASLPYKIKSENIVKLQEVDGRQLIIFNEELINVNKKLGKAFPKDTKFKVTTWEQLYAGINYEPNEKIEEYHE